MKNAERKASRLYVGQAQEVNSREEVVILLDLLAKKLQANFKGEDVVKEALRFVDNGEIKYVSYNVIMGMNMITLPIEVPAEDGEEEFDMTSEYGVFSYVYNVDADWCSELGYTVFEEILGDLVRIA